MMAFNCPICGSGEVKVWGENWYRCSRHKCRHLFRFPQPGDEELRQFYKKIYYPTAGEAELENTPPHVASQILSWFGSLEGKSLLDVGCGEGTFWQVLPDSARARYVGIEFDALAASSASRVSGRPVFLSIEALAQGGRYSNFDLILMCQSIEHLTHPVATLRALRQVAHKDTLLLIATPNANSFAACVKKSHWIQAQNPTHFHLFSASSLRTALRQAGWPASSTIRAPIQYQKGQPLKDIARRGMRAIGRDGNLTSIVGSPGSALVHQKPD